jgi:hypothetical protein
MFGGSAAELESRWEAEPQHKSVPRRRPLFVIAKRERQPKGKVHTC